MEENYSNEGVSFSSDEYDDEHKNEYDDRKAFTQIISKKFSFGQTARGGGLGGEGQR